MINGLNWNRFRNFSFSKKIVAAIIISVIIIVASVIYFRCRNNTKNIYLEINSHKITVEIAASEQERMRGLSGREKLNQDSGMLFIFPESGRAGFWMHGMRFNLDFIFIETENNTGRVVSIRENVPLPKTGESPQIIYSQTPYDIALEVNAGTLNRLEIRVGDKVRLYGIR